MAMKPISFFSFFLIKYIWCFYEEEKKEKNEEEEKNGHWNESMKKKERKKNKEEEKGVPGVTFHLFIDSGSHICEFNY